MKSLIFKTSVKRIKAALTLQNLLPHYFKGAKIQFDAIQKQFLMQINAPKLSQAKVISTMNDLRFKCEVSEKLIVWKVENLN